MQADIASPPLARPDYQLLHNLWAPSGSVFLTGTQALVRLLLMQRARDAKAGTNTQGFVSGYRGSPLGMVDQAIWKAGPKFTGGRHPLRAGDQRGARGHAGAGHAARGVRPRAHGRWRVRDVVRQGPGRRSRGRRAQARQRLWHSPHGGVLVVAGDDHGCVSSSMPHQSDLTFQAWSMPIVAPANVAEYLEFGLYGWALSRFSGTWVGFTALSEVVESGATVDLDAIARASSAWLDADAVPAAIGYRRRPTACTTAGPICPRSRIESRLDDKLAAVRAFARVNSSTAR